MAEPRIHQHWLIEGQVQAVGFRPFVVRLARQLGICGEVCNVGGSVSLELQGTSHQLSKFQQELHRQQPSRARIDRVSIVKVRNDADYTGFHAVASRIPSGSPSSGLIPSDHGVCQACLAELFAPDNRRYLHPFISCTDCGPRYSISERLPFDRQNTSMAVFALCPACQAEYQNPGNRRFHAETIACHECGPTLWLQSANGQTQDRQTIRTAANLLRAGEILVIKGIGGFHLACLADCSAAIKQLRKAKQRPDKPLALMVLNPPTAANYCRLSDEDIRVLHSPGRPIVLMPLKTAGFDNQSSIEMVAPGLNKLGIMLPYTPVHYLLFHALLGQPAGIQWLQEDTRLALIMTSANYQGEPVLFDGKQCREQWGSRFSVLGNDRRILNPADDSLCIASPRPQWLRQGRGVTPMQIRLPRKMPAVMGCGALLKNTLCLLTGDQALHSPYIGDLDTPANCERFEAEWLRLQQHTQTAPQAVACDWHADFFSSQYAERFATEHDLPLFRYQHHHAHAAAVLAEHRVEEHCLALVLDGFGLGTGQAVWGGELLQVRGGEFQRLGHLSELPLPGGDAASKAP